MIFEIKTKKDSFVSKLYAEAMQELDLFFKLNWKHHRPRVIVIPDRKTIDQLYGQKTEKWMVGWLRGNDIYILDRKKYSKESCHKYSEIEYKALIKHELAHAFMNVITKGTNKPNWLSEGVSMYLAGQNEFRKKPAKFEVFLLCYEQGNKRVYNEAGFAVQVLVQKYGKEKILRLIKSSKKIKTKKEFEQMFRQIYGALPTYEFFNKIL